MADKPTGWPRHIQPFGSLDDLQRLGTDAKNQLYWDGKQVRTRLTLTWPQTILAILAALASIATIFTGLNNASVFLCGRAVTWLGCPPPVGSVLSSPVPVHAP